MSRGTETGYRETILLSPSCPPTFPPSVPSFYSFNENLLNICCSPSRFSTRFWVKIKNKQSLYFQMPSNLVWGARHEERRVTKYLGTVMDMMWQIEEFFYLGVERTMESLLGKLKLVCDCQSHCFRPILLLKPPKVQWRPEVFLLLSHLLAIFFIPVPSRAARSVL